MLRELENKKSKGFRK